MKTTTTRDEIKSRLRAEGTREARFALAGMRRDDERGGRPRAIERGGRIVFVWPDGTEKVCG